MAEFTAGELVRWDPSHYPAGTPGSQGVCRFAPGCATKPDHPTCPNAPAEFSEALGGAGATILGWPPKRWMAICEPRAVRRFGEREVAQTRAEA